MVMKTIAKCQYCGKEFFYDKVTKEKKYCSESCARSAKYERKHPGPVIVKCKSCGKEFIKDMYSPRRVYCSDECVKKAHAVSVKKGLQKLLQHSKCEWCGKEFTHNYSSRDRKTCSKECYNEVMKFHRELQVEQGLVAKGWNHTEETKIKIANSKIGNGNAKGNQTHRVRTDIFTVKTVGIIRYLIYKLYRAIYK